MVDKLQGAGVVSDEHLLELLAEMELLRRKARLLDARLAAWESRLDDACASVDGLLASVDTRRDPEARLGALEARVERLARRRTPADPMSEPVPEASAPTVAPSGFAPSPGARAIVFARWLVEEAPAPSPIEAGSKVELLADVDGIPPGTTVPVAIHPLDSATTLVTLDAVSDGHCLRAAWSIPEACVGRAWCFTARLRSATSTSPPLYVG